MKKLVKKVFPKINKSGYLYILSVKAMNLVFRLGGGSGDYWERRYISGGGSGPGSYNRLAQFKADIVNSLLNKYKINNVIEWGCGDGNQLSLIRYPNYLGIDVSAYSIEICRQRYVEDKTKQFLTLGEVESLIDQFELSISLDVIYHLVEENVYQQYMDRLFTSSNQYVCIYSSNVEKPQVNHVRERCFTKYIEKNFPDFELVEHIPNVYPFREDSPEDTSFAEFYLFERK